MKHTLKPSSKRLDLPFAKTNASELHKVTILRQDLQIQFMIQITNYVIQAPFSVDYQHRSKVKFAGKFLS